MTLEAAQKRHDAIVCHRMLSCPDLFAFNAKYHRSCYTHFIYTRKIFAAQKRHLAEANVTVYDEATKVVFQAAPKFILGSKIEIVLMSDIHQTFVCALTDLGVFDPESYTTWKLKE